jgi:hypothetical protein
VGWVVLGVDWLGEGCVIVSVFEGAYMLFGEF